MCVCVFDGLDSRSFHSAGTGEHGVGVGKKEYLPAELGEGTVELMRTVKKAIDPLNLMNPGKVRKQWFFTVNQLMTAIQLYPDQRVTNKKDEKER